MYLNKKLIVSILFLLLLSCNSTKILKTGNLRINNFDGSLEGKTKEEIVQIMGKPNSIDPIDNSYIYYNEIRENKNIFNKKIISRDIYLIRFNEKNIFISMNQYSMNDENKLKIVKSTTQDELVERGFIEKVFGGVGKQTTLPGIPSANTGN